MKVVVVESPAKAKTINRYLGDGYKVLRLMAMFATCQARTDLFCLTMTLR